MTADMSMRDMGDMMQECIRHLFPDKCACMVDMYPTSDPPYAIVEVRDKTEYAEGGVMVEMGKGQPEMHKIPYTMTEDGKMQAGTPERVRKETAYVKFAAFAGAEGDYADGAEYEWEEAGGKYTIRNVPIFALGTHRGFDYSDEWAARAIGNHARMKADSGYRPVIVVGHTDGKAEKPAVGFIDNLRKAGRLLIADLAGIAKETFEQIRKGNWPYRSIEVFDRDALITALALLGGTPPYMKSAPLAFTSPPASGFGASGDRRWINWPAKENTEMDQNDNGAQTMTLPPEVLDSLKAEIRQEFSAAIEAEKNAREAAENEARASREEVKRLAAKDRDNELKQFRHDLVDLGYSPAIISTIAPLAENVGPVKFADGKEAVGLDAVRKLFADIATAHKGGTLFVSIGEIAEVKKADAPGIEGVSVEGVARFANVKNGKGESFPIDADSLAEESAIKAAIAEGKYNHLPEPKRYRQALLDVRAARRAA